MRDSLALLLPLLVAELVPDSAAFLPKLQQLRWNGESALRAMRDSVDHMDEHHEVVIVGGGTGGLFAAKQLIEKGIEDVVALEARAFVGGRVQTRRDDDGNPILNNFAWRVGDTNTMIMDLCEELDIELVKQTTVSSIGSKSEKEQQTKMNTAAKRPPLSDFASSALTSAKNADQQDRATGYAEKSSQIKFPNEPHDEEFWFVNGGMDRIPKELSKKLPEGCVRTNHRVAQVAKLDDGEGYRVSIVQRDGDEFVPLTFTCNQLVLATPPFALRNLAISGEMAPALYAVDVRRVAHAYAKCKPNTNNVPDRSDVPDRVYQKLPDSVLQQVISGDYGHGVFQAAYASGRYERVWRELQFQGLETVNNAVKQQLNMLSDLPSPPEGWSDAIEEVYIHAGFVHRWLVEAHLAGKTKEDLALQAITPNPGRLPGLYLVGEAFSPYQGWTEGALWTADKVTDIIGKARLSHGKYNYPGNDALSEHSRLMNLSQDNAGKLSAASTPNIMVYKGMVVDIDDWAARHPGGKGMIQNHAGEDISELFDNFHPGWPVSMASIFGLQIGCTDM